MNQITEIILNGAISVLTILAGIAIQELKKYLLKKGGKRAVEITEIVAKNAVNAVEQIVTGDHVDKYDLAKRRVTSELEKYNIYMSESQLETFIESAVKQMNDAWKGGVEDVKSK
ncbi:phage holin [Streptococcus cameli]